MEHLHRDKRYDGSLLINISKCSLLSNYSTVNFDIRIKEEIKSNSFAPLNLTTEGFSEKTCQLRCTAPTRAIWGALTQLWALWLDNWIKRGEYWNLKQISRVHALPHSAKRTSGAKKKNCSALTVKQFSVS